MGYPKFREGKPFASSLITHFRKRFSADILKEVNERIVMAAKQEMKDDDNNPPTSSGGSANEKEMNCENSGKMILDATCTPADIQYPTDTRLLNEARVTGRNH